MTELKKAIALFEELRLKLDTMGPTASKKGSDLKEHSAALDTLQKQGEEQLAPVLKKQLAKAQLPADRRLLNEKTCSTIVSLNDDYDKWKSDLLGGEMSAANNGSAAVDAAKAKKERKFHFAGLRKELEELEGTFRAAVCGEEKEQHAIIADAFEKRNATLKKFAKRVAHHDHKAANKDMAPSTASKTDLARAKKEVETGVSLLTKLETVLGACIDAHEEEFDLLVATEDARWTELVESAQESLGEVFEAQMLQEEEEENANRNRRWTKNILTDCFIRLPQGNAEEEGDRRRTTDDDHLLTSDELSGTIPWFPFEAGTHWKVESVVGPRYQLSLQSPPSDEASIDCENAAVADQFDITIELYDVAFELIFCPFRGTLVSPNESSSKAVISGRSSSLPTRRDQLVGTVHRVPATTAASATSAAGAMQQGIQLTKTQRKKLKKKHHEKAAGFVASPSQRVDPATLPAPRVALVLAQGGYFAGAVFDLHEVTTKPVVHKTFARYITRKGQGGRQSAHNGRTDTAGSQIRAQMEKKWTEESTALMQQWVKEGHFETCHSVLAHAPGPSNHAMVLGKESPLGGAPSLSSAQACEKAGTRHGSVVRTLPIASGRPTLSEVQRCLEQLLSGSIVAERRQ